MSYQKDYPSIQEATQYAGWDDATLIVQILGFIHEWAVAQMVPTIQALEKYLWECAYEDAGYPEGPPPYDAATRTGMYDRDF